MLQKVFYKSREFQVRQKVIKNEVALESTMPTIQSSMVANMLTIQPTRLLANNSAHRVFRKKFSNNPFGFPCGICDQLWFKNNLNKITQECQQLLNTVFPGVNLKFFNNG
ncbi:hypothetical protein V1478_010545, partial [Vespula squamosa]